MGHIVEFDSGDGIRVVNMENKPMTNNPKAERTLTAEELQAIIDGCEGVQGGPWKLDKFACYVWAPSQKGGDFPVMDDPGENGRVVGLRGWGYYTGKGHGALGLTPEEARAHQQKTGEHVARLDPETVKAMALELQALRSQSLSTQQPMGEPVAYEVMDKLTSFEHNRVRYIGADDNWLPSARLDTQGFSLRPLYALHPNQESGE